MTRVFLLDDHEVVRRGVRELIDAEDDLEVVGEASTAGEALARVKLLSPDVAILDIGMPGMSGYEVAQQMRREAWGAGIVLVAITGWGQEEDKRRARAAGFDHHLTKPVDPVVLEQLISQL